MHSLTSSCARLSLPLLVLAMIVGIAEQSSATDQGQTLHVANNGVDSAVCGPTASPCRSIGRRL